MSSSTHLSHSVPRVLHSSQLLDKMKGALLLVALVAFVAADPLTEAGTHCRKVDPACALGVPEAALMNRVMPIKVAEHNKVLFLLPSFHLSIPLMYPFQCVKEDACPLFVAPASNIACVCLSKPSLLSATVQHCLLICRKTAWLESTLAPM